MPYAEQEHPEDEAMRLAGDAVEAVNKLADHIGDMHEDSARMTLEALLAALGRVSDKFTNGRTA